MQRPVHTPYDGSARLFQIGLSLLDPAEWIEVDEDLDSQLALKQELACRHLNQVFLATDESRPAQQECLALLVDNLARFHRETHAVTANSVSVAGQTFDLADGNVSPLFLAGSMVQEDLLLLNRKAAGWHLAAGHLSFPSSWSLVEKFGRPMEEIHQPVPDFGKGSRNADMINRIFDRLPVDAPVKRMNWSINDRPDLFLPSAQSGKDFSVNIEEVHVRVERQTLRKLEKSGDIVFSIRIHVDPLRSVMAMPAAIDFASAFAAQIAALSPEQSAYKGLNQRQKSLVETILAMAAGNRS